MKKYCFLICSMLLITQVYAADVAVTNDGFASEMGHVVGGAVAAGGVTAIVDYYYPEYAENRGMIGFGVSSIVFIVIEGVEIARHGNAKGNLLDIASHIVGSALGAFVTDKYILSPVIKNSATGGKSVGFKVEYSF